MLKCEFFAFFNFTLSFSILIFTFLFRAFLQPNKKATNCRFLAQISKT
jgi:hypothetical protein